MEIEEKIGILVRRLHQVRGSLQLARKQKEAAQAKIDFHLALLEELRPKLAQLKTELRATPE